MEFIPEYEDLIGIGLAILCGSIVGFEREFRNKAAGFRTVVLICLGSTVFTIISRYGVGSDDRIAANIITGIGFIGAGVIFKGKVSVQGLTTAAVIWVAAGIGMAAGAGYHSLAITITLATLIILVLFSKAEQLLAISYYSTTIYITFQQNDMSDLKLLDEFALAQGVRIKRKVMSKRNERLSIVLEAHGNRERIQNFTEQLIKSDLISEVQYN